MHSQQAPDLARHHLTGKQALVLLAAALQSLGAYN